MDLDSSEKCLAVFILFWLLLSLALMIVFVYLYGVTPNESYRSNYIAGIVVSGASFVVFAVLLAHLLKIKFYSLHPDSVYRHPENLQQ